MRPRAFLVPGFMWKWPLIAGFSATFIHFYGQAAVWMKPDLLFSRFHPLLPEGGVLDENSRGLKGDFHPKRAGPGEMDENPAPGPAKHVNFFIQNHKKRRFWMKPPPAAIIFSSKSCVFLRFG